MCQLMQIRADFGGAWIEPFRTLGLNLFGSEMNLRILLGVAVGLHTLEAVFAVSGLLFDVLAI